MNRGRNLLITQTEINQRREIKEKTKLARDQDGYEIAFDHVLGDFLSENGEFFFS